MGRYFTETNQKAKKELNHWVKKMAADVDSLHNDVELHNVSLMFRPPFERDGRQINNGFVSMDIKFNYEPPFLTLDDRNLWYKRVKEIGISRFSIPDADYYPQEFATIPFEEPSQGELYRITPNKEATIRDGFERINRFVEWYFAAVKDYENVVQAHNKRMQQHLADLETLSG